MINCDQALDLISALLDGELQDDDRALLDAHLNQCDQCRALLSDFHAMHAALPTTDVEPPADLKDNIMAQVRASKVVALTPPAARKWGRRQWRSLVAVLAVVVLGAGGLRLLKSPAVSGGDDAPAVQPAVLQADAGGATTEEGIVAPRSIAPADASVGGVAPALMEPESAPYAVHAAPTNAEMYCGIVVLSDTSGLTLADYPWQQVDCELHYTLPAADFTALLPLLEGRSDVVITLEGTAISSDGESGVVIVIPATP